jgi:hypothetical protein
MLNAPSEPVENSHNVGLPLLRTPSSCLILHSLAEGRAAIAL